MSLWQIKILLLLLNILAPSASFAALVLYNDPSLPASADGMNITRDTSTGLEWLDVDVSVGRTFDDLTGVDGTNEFIPGGDFAGFRYAIKQELTGAQNGPQLPSLHLSLGISPFSFSDIGSYPDVRGLLAINGCFGACAVAQYFQGVAPAAYGYVYGAILLNDGVTEAEASLETFRHGSNNWGRHNPSSPPVINNPPNDAFVPPVLKGNWLVRAVPIPAPFVLLLTGLTILTVRTKTVVA